MHGWAEEVSIMERGQPMTQKFLRDAVILMATINPVEVLCIFIAISEGMSPEAARRAALRAVLFAAGVLLGFLVLGQVVLDVMEISMASFQIAGGVVLFLFGIRMIFEHRVGGAPDHAESGHDVAVFPLAMPTIACPGSILAVVMLTDNDIYPPTTQAMTGLIMLAILAVTFVTLAASQRIYRLLGKSGAAILIRIMGLMLAALAVEEVLKGLALAGVLVNA